METGSSRLKARRIALAAAELAERLRRVRLAEAKRLRVRSTAAERRRAAAAQTRVGIGASATLASVGPGDLFLTGPGLSGELRLGRSARLDLGAAWLLGTAPVLAASPPIEWIELGLAPAYVTTLAPGLGFDVGARFSAASVHVDDVLKVDDVATEQDSWSARAVGFARIEPRLGYGFVLGVAPELGVVLRRIPVVDEAGTRHRLGGFWLGGMISVSYDRASL